MQQKDTHKLMLESVQMQRKTLKATIKMLLLTFFLVVLAILTFYLTHISVFDKNIIELSTIFQTSIYFVRLLIVLTLFLVLSLFLSFHCVLSNLPVIPKKNRKDAIEILKGINSANDFYITSIRSLTNINRDDAYICLILLVEYNYVYEIIREQFGDSHMYIKYVVSPKGAKFLNKHNSLK